MRCKYCNSVMIPWTEPLGNPVPSGFDESYRLCENEECPHFLESLGLFEDKTMGYRYMKAPTGEEINVLSGLKYLYGAEPGEDGWDEEDMTEWIERLDVSLPLVEVNEKGGKQSKEPYRMDLVNPEFMLDIAKVLGEGADKYGERNYRKISKVINVGRAIKHLYKYMSGDQTEPHLVHAACRIMFAFEEDSNE